MTEKAGVTGMPQNPYGMGVAVGDYDNDGFEDLYVTNYGANTLYRNNGDGTFDDVTARAGVAAGGWSASAGFLDYDNDGKLDLFVTRYLDWTFENNRHCGEKRPGYRAYCHPDNFDADHQRPVPEQRRRHVHRRVGEGRGSRARRGKGLGVAFADYDDDGFDGRVRGERFGAVVPVSQQRHGTFSEVGLLAGVGLQRGREDVRGHGRGLRRLRQRRPARRVRHRPLERALPPVSQQRRRELPGRDEYRRRRRGDAAFSGWSTRFFDYDNDGWKDVFVAQGHVMDTIEKTSPNLRYLQPPLLLRNERGRFVRVMAGDAVRAGLGRPRGRVRRPRQRRRHRHRREQRRASRRWCCGTRAATANGWLAIRTVGTPIEPGRHRGAREGRHGVRRDPALHRHTAVGYLSASDKRLLVGLGGDAVAAQLVEIRWPSGIVQTFENVKAGQMLVAHRSPRR